MTTPLERLSPARQKRVFFITLGLTMLLLVVFGFIDAPLTTPSAPYGIVSFELAGTENAASDILQEWDPRLGYAVFSLALDFLFIPSYVITIGLGCLLGGRSLREQRWPLAGIGSYLVYALISAGALDVIENGALLIQVFSLPRSPWPQVAFYTAVVKFALIFLGLVYALYGGTISILKILEKNDRP